MKIHSKTKPNSHSFSWIGILGILILLTAPWSVLAASLKSRVIDTRAVPVKDAIISAYPQVSKELPGFANRPQAKIIQRDRQFEPFILPVQTGTAIQFPNEDNIKHHVYSFSRAKRFELKLYSGTPTEPIIFNRPGVVILGCNIHDWMIAYIYVMDTKYFGKTDEEGDAIIANLPQGTYRVTVWHPRMRGKSDSHDRKITLTTQETVDLTFTLHLKRERKRRVPPDYGERGYRHVP